jgi:hypothetical protein
MGQAGMPGLPELQLQPSSRLALYHMESKCHSAAVSQTCLGLHGSSPGPPVGATHVTYRVPMPRQLGLPIRPQYSRSLAATRSHAHVPSWPAAGGRKSWRKPVVRAARPPPPAGRGRHTPRSRLSSEMCDTAAAAVGVLDTSDLESYLAANFAPVSHGQLQPGHGLGEEPGFGHGLPPGAGGGGGPGGLVMHGSFGGLGEVTGNMASQLVLNDAAAAQRLGQAAGGAAATYGAQHGLGMQPGPQRGYGGDYHPAASPYAAAASPGGMGGYAGAGPGSTGMGYGSGGGGGGGLGQAPGGEMGFPPAPHDPLHRVLKKSESDSFKRFLNTGLGVEGGGWLGLPFSPGLETAPEDLDLS